MTESPHRAEHYFFCRYGLSCGWEICQPQMRKWFGLRIWWRRAIVNVASTTKTSLRLYTSVRLTSYGVSLFTNPVHSGACCLVCSSPSGLGNA